MNVSRQAISRWEGAAALPDVTNVLQLSKLFGVTTDYLLNDEYESDNDLPKVKETKKDGIHQIMIFMVTLEVMTALLFGVTTDYLLNDEYESDNDLPKVKETKKDGIHQIMIFMVTLEVMTALVQFMTTFILQSEFLGVLSFLPFVAVIGGFEYGYQKKKSEADETTRGSRKKFYKKFQHG